MAGESDIRAGGAYIEIGGKTAGLDKALSGVQSKMSAFGASMAGIGAKVAAAAGVVTGLGFAATKSFGDFAKEMTVLSERTGIGLRALSGFKILAAESGSSLEQFAHSIRLMQVAITDGSPDAQKALQQLGLSAADLQGLAPEDQFNQIADAFAAVSNPAERATIASRLFGRAGQDMIPVLARGSAGLEAATQRAFRYGVGLDEAGAKKGLAARAAWSRLTVALEGFTNRLGAALAPLTSYIARLGEVVARAGQWVALNPELVGGAMKIALAASLIATAFVGVGLAIMAAMSPAFLMAGAVVALGMAVLAVTDTLGVTDTGFAELFNSIKVGGLGLADWFTYVWKHIEAGWTVLTTNLSISWETVWGAIKDVGRGAYQFMLDTVELMAFAFDAGIGGIVENLNLIVAAYNAVAEKIHATPISFFEKSGLSEDMLATVRKLSDENQAAGAADKAAREKSIEGSLYKRDKALGVFGKEATAIEARGTGESGVSVDAEKLRGAFVGIGDKAFDAIQKVLAGLMGKLPELPGAPAGGPKTPGMPGGIEKTNWSAVGTFSGYAATQMAGAGSVFNQQLEVQRRIAAASEKTARNTESGDAPETT